MRSLKEIECYAFDMDGTVNLGDELIDGALELTALFRERGIRYFFFTNNSSKSPMDYVDKLTRLGFPGVVREDVMTSGDVMVHYLKTHWETPHIYLAGTPELERQFREEGIVLLPADTREADAVVLGFDTTLNYQKIDTVCRLAAQGIPFLATNIDRVCPLPGGAFLPDCGSMCKLVEHATGKTPVFVGKPFAHTVDYILDAAGTQPDRTAMVGDRLYTDIATAVNGGIIGIAVLSGEISQKDIDESDIQPDFVFKSVKELYEELKK